MSNFLEEAQKIEAKLFKSDEDYREIARLYRAAAEKKTDWTQSSSEMPLTVLEWYLLFIAKWKI